MCEGIHLIRRLNTFLQTACNFSLLEAFRMDSLPTTKNKNRAITRLVCLLAFLFALVSQIGLQFVIGVSEASIFIIILFDHIYRPDNATYFSFFQRCQIANNPLNRGKESQLKLEDFHWTEQLFTPSSRSSLAYWELIGVARLNSWRQRVRAYRTSDDSSLIFEEPIKIHTREVLDEVEVVLLLKSDWPLTIKRAMGADCTSDFIRREKCGGIMRQIFWWLHDSLYSAGVSIHFALIRKTNLNGSYSIQVILYRHRLVQRVNK